jgi:hypothetical protein
VPCLYLDSVTNVSKPLKYVNTSKLRSIEPLELLAELDTEPGAQPARIATALSLLQLLDAPVSPPNGRASTSYVFSCHMCSRRESR